MAAFYEDDDVVHIERIVEFLPSEVRRRSRSQLRTAARWRAVEEMKQMGMEPAYSQHPHATMVREGVWSVRGWWQPTEGYAHDRDDV